MAVNVQVVFDCAGPKALAEFWKVALNYQTDPPPKEFDSWGDALKAWGLPDDYDEVNAIVDPEGAGPRIFFQKVPEAKITKNRVHLDVGVGRGIVDSDQRWELVQAHVAKLSGVGAAVVEERRGEFGDDRWVVMTDPEGNEFCVQ